MSTTLRPGRLVLALDVGGTKTLTALADMTGKIVGRLEFPTRGHTEPDDVAHAAQLACDFAARHLAAPGPQPAELAAVALGVPEYVDPAGQLTSNEVLRWHTQPGRVFAQTLTNHGLGAVPVAVDSDVRLGARGEAVAGSGQNLESFLYISLGTGLSCAFVAQGRVWPGQRGEAIALGEWPAAVVGPPPGGRQGGDACEVSLESYASGAGIARRFSALRAGTHTTVDISALASGGDDVAAHVLLSAGRALGHAISMLVAVLDPHAVVVGGGLGTGEPLVWQALTQSYAQSRGSRPHPPPVLRAAAGSDAGLLGAIDVGLQCARQSGTVPPP